jgi:GntR family transcriptional regulator
MPRRTNFSKAEWLAQVIRERIQQGHYPAGYRLPPVSDFRREFKVSQDTVVAALNRLLAEGYVYQRQSLTAAIWIVRPQGGGIIVGSPLFDQFLREQGLIPITDNVIDPEIIPAPSTVAQYMQIEPGTPVIHRLRIQGTEDMIYRLHEQWYPAKLAAPLLEAMRENPNLNVAGEIRRITEGNVALTTIRDDVTARLPTTQEAQLLRVTRTTPLLEVVKTFLDQNGTVMTLARSLLVGGLFTLRFEYPHQRKEPVEASPSPSSSVPPSPLPLLPTWPDQLTGEGKSKAPTSRPRPRSSTRKKGDQQQ